MHCQNCCHNAIFIFVHCGVHEPCAVYYEREGGKIEKNITLTIVPIINTNSPDKQFQFWPLSDQPRLFE